MSIQIQKTRATPNDLKLSDSGVRRGTCTVGGKAAAEAGAVTHGAVRCSAWLGDSGLLEWILRAMCFEGVDSLGGFGESMLCARQRPSVRYDLVGVGAML